MWGCLGRRRWDGNELIVHQSGRGGLGTEHKWLFEHGSTTSRPWDVSCVSSCGRGGESVISKLMA